MARLDQIARVIRSKNAGPFCLTLDVLYGDDASYRRVPAAQVITREKMAALYRQPDVATRAVALEQARCCPVAACVLKCVARPFRSALSFLKRTETPR